MIVITKSLVEHLLSKSLIITYELNNRKAHRSTTSEIDLHVVRVQHFIFFNKYVATYTSYKGGESFGIRVDVSNPKEAFYLLEECL